MIREKLLNKEIYKEKLGSLANIGIRLFFSLFLVIFLTGCNKKALSAKIFTTIMEENNYSVVDVSSDDNKNILAVGDHFQVYFYKFKNEKLANKSIKKSIKELNSEDNKIVKEEKDNYLKYEISNNNIYTIYYMVDNTYIYISTTSNYKKDAVDLIKLLGY